MVGRRPGAVLLLGLQPRPLEEIPNSLIVPRLTSAWVLSLVALQEHIDSRQEGVVASKETPRPQTDTASDVKPPSQLVATTVTGHRLRAVRRPASLATYSSLPFTVPFLILPAYTRGAFFL